MKAPAEASRDFAKELWSRSRRLLNAHSFQIAPGDRMLLNQVGAGSVGDYLYGGFTVGAGIRAILQLLHIDRTPSFTVLDFGCGPGRVTAWLGDLATPNHLHGVDVNEQAINWC